jgi:predicted DNA-binding transcriptional regulator AlpA
MQTTRDSDYTYRDYRDVLARLVDERLIREPERKKITGTSRAHWHRLEVAGRAPRRIAISERIVAWRLTEIMAWVHARAAGEEWTA